MGHEDAFPRPTLSARYRFGQGTFAGTRGNERDAPIPDLPPRASERKVRMAAAPLWVSSAEGTVVAAFSDRFVG